MGDMLAASIVLSLPEGTFRIYRFDGNRGGHTYKGGGMCISKVYFYNCTNLLAACLDGFDMYRFIQLGILSTVTHTTCSVGVGHVRNRIDIRPNKGRGRTVLRQCHG
jgi:hypothetical protein